MSKKKLLTSLVILGVFATSAFAGTGGAELQSWYTDISNALQGFWGKIIAAVFIGIAILLFKGGAIIGGIFMIMLGLSIGTIPSIIDSKYTALAYEPQTVELLDSITKLFQ